MNSKTYEANMKRMLFLYNKTLKRWSPGSNIDSDETQTHNLRTTSLEFNQESGALSITPQNHTHSFLMICSPS